ncbi:MAG TPA: helix-turn-helix transcriptional regulator [Gemmatimonadaceae bacterium]|nr:helix-turn-helix transcriptional regulator [Gemmatimonadaceae bacterium]
MKGDPDELLPLRAVDVHVLLALSHRDRHGYGLVQDIAGESEGRLQLLPGNLYGVLSRLMRDGLVREKDHRGAREHDERRRYYGITPLGKRVLAAELARMRDVLRLAETRRLLERPRTVP